MAEQELNRANVGAVFQQVNGERMSKQMWRDGFPNLRIMVGLPAFLFNCMVTDVSAR